MDGSGSVGDCEFKRGKVAIKNLMKSANAIAVEKRYDEKYAAVTFSTSASVNFKFLPYSTAERRLSMINFPSGAANTQAELAEARNLFLESLTGTVYVSLSLRARQPGRVLNRLNARQSERFFESLRNPFPLALECIVSSARIFIIFFSYMCLVHVQSSEKTINSVTTQQLNNNHARSSMSTQVIAILQYLDTLTLTLIS